MDIQAARELHKGYDAICERCGEKYCPECESACPSCCLHNDCIAVTERDAALEAQEEIRVECEGYGKPIGYDPTYALAQKILAILGESE